MNYVIHYMKYIWMLLGGIWGWFCGIFEPSFPLIIIATLFIVWDAYSAYELDVRVHKAYPDKTQRHEAKFVSWKFRTVIPTLIERYVLIFLSYLVQKYIFIDIYVPVSYIAAGVVVVEQFWSVCENKASCRGDNEKYSKLWFVMGKIFADKTERHFDIDLSGLTPDEVQIQQARERAGHRKPRQRKYKNDDTQYE